MDGSNATHDGDSRDRWRSLVGIGSELLWYVLVLTLWTIGLTFLFLTTGWPRWAFYASLLGGVVVFATLYPGRSRT